jgi:RimJ/RimL family protein N-acetyltransferase
MTLLLREVEGTDLPIFFGQQLEPEANYMAAFTTKHPEDRAAFDAHWAKILADESTNNKTILFEGQIAGHISSFIMFEERNVSYWLGKAYWGKGIASSALTEFLSFEKTRPLYGRVVKDNLASIRVLEKCGFKISGYDNGFANARGEEVEEVILKLETRSERVTMTQTAKGTFEVKLKPQPLFHETSPLFGRMSIDKTFHGDLTATSAGEMLSARTGIENSAGYVAIEMVSGTLHERKGSFALQHSSFMTRGEPQQSITVVPDSATDELVGLSGSMTIDIREGHHFYELKYGL